MIVVGPGNVLTCYDLKL